MKASVGIQSGRGFFCENRTLKDRGRFAGLFPGPWPIHRDSADLEFAAIHRDTFAPLLLIDGLVSQNEYSILRMRNQETLSMKTVTAIITLVWTLATSALTHAQTDGGPPQDVPAFPVPELQNVIPELARAVELIGLNRVEDSFNSLKTELNPAFRSEGAHEKFRESWMKLFLQIGRLRLEFESYDIVGYYRVSSQSYFVYGTANGANGPVMFDFRVFRYRGRWHVHGFSFNVSGWSRKPEMHEDAVKLDSPVVYLLGTRPVAFNETPIRQDAPPSARRIARVPSR